MVKIVSVSKINGYNEALLEIKLPLPANLKDLKNKNEVAQTYQSQYGISKVVGNDVYFNKVLSFNTKEELMTICKDILSKYQQDLNNFILADVDELIGMTYNGIEFIYE